MIQKQQQQMFENLDLKSLYNIINKGSIAMSEVSDYKFTVIMIFMVSVFFVILIFLYKISKDKNLKFSVMSFESANQTPDSKPTDKASS